MIPAETAALSAQLADLHTEVAKQGATLDELHADVLEVKGLQKETNGRVRHIEIWQATVSAGLTAAAKLADAVHQLEVWRGQVDGEHAAIEREEAQRRKHREIALGTLAGAFAAFIGHRLHIY